MPRRDGTGPTGQKPMSGRGLGVCNGEQSAEANPNFGKSDRTGKGVGRGRGQGMSNGLGRGRGSAMRGKNSI